MADTSGMEKYYLPVHPHVFRINTTRVFDIYAKNSEGKFSVFHPADEVYTADIHARVYKWNIPSFYIKNNEKARFQRYMEENFPVIIGDPFINTRNKAEIAHDMLIFLAAGVFTAPTSEAIQGFKKTIEAVVDFVDKNDDALKFIIRRTSTNYYEFNHSVNVGVFGLGLAKEVFREESDHNIKELACGFFLHDIGKFTIPRHICKRNGPLSEEEWLIMKKHPEQGYKILEKFNALSDEISIIVLQHHERANGNGYPLGLKGAKIHLYGKICAIADVFDALSSDRPYRSAKTSFNALAVMQNEMKGEFDNELFSKFVKLFSRQ